MTPAAAAEVLRAAARAGQRREGEIRLDLKGPVARLHLANPRARNALTAQMMVQWLDAIARLQDWQGAALVLSAEPCGAFCSGGHLGDVRDTLTRPEIGRAMATAMRDATDRLLALPVVSVCAIDGVAMGGGAELCTATDLRVATPGSRIHFVQAKLGVAAGWGGAGRLIRHIGRRAALRLLGTAAPVAVEEAQSIGLVDVVASDAPAAALSLLEPYLANPTAAVRASKQQVLAAERRDGAAESEAFLGVWGGPAHRAALGTTGSKA